MRLLLFLYNIILILIAPFAFVIGYISSKSKGDAQGYGERFGLLKLNQSPRTKSVWFHAASVGEVRSIKNIVDKIRLSCPDTAVIISTMTTTGRLTAKTYLNADEAFLLPIENSTAISYLIKLMGVKVFFVVDTEIWPNMITAAAKETAIIMINARVSERTIKSYMRFRFLFGYVLRKFDKIFTKSPADTERFEQIVGNKRIIQTAGNIKFQSRKNIDDIKPVTDFQNEKIFLAASTHPGEEKFILTNIKKHENTFDKIIITPRHINRSAEIKTLAESLGYKTGLYSANNFADCKVVVIDAFGMLESLYIISRKIFIGGSIAQVGGHNIYEALQFYKSVGSGPNIWNFAEIFHDAQDFGLTATFISEAEFDNWIQNQIEPSHKNFDGFFRLTDDKNKKIIDLIVAEANIYLNDEKK